MPELSEWPSSVHGPFPGLRPRPTLASHGITPGGDVLRVRCSRLPDVLETPHEAFSPSLTRSGVCQRGWPMVAPLQAQSIAEEFDSLHFRSIGPATMSGRVSDLAVYEANPAIYYVATAHSGLWKTTSGGALFEPLFQNEGLIALGDVAISQTDPDLVWVGAGESNNRQTTSWGGGIYKSTDGGQTFEHMGLENSRHINRILDRSSRQRCRARCCDRTALRLREGTAVSSRRPMVVRTGPRSSESMTTPVPTRSCAPGPTSTRCTRRPTSVAATPAA